MKKVIFLLIASLAITITACNKEKIKTVDPSDLTINLNKAELQQRIEILNYPVTFNTFKATPTPPFDGELWAVAQIHPATVDTRLWHWYLTLDPTVKVNTTTSTSPGAAYSAAAIPMSGEANQPLSMTAAAVVEDGGDYFAYFASHIYGTTNIGAGNSPNADYGGEIFVVQYANDAAIDDDVFSTPLIAQASIFDQTVDFNDLTIDPNGERLWIAGDNNARGAVVRYANTARLNAMGDSTVSDLFLSVPVLYEYRMPMLGPSGNSITIPRNHTSTHSAEDQQLWVVAGGHSYGGLIVMDKTDDSRLFTRTDKTHAKHFDIYDSIQVGSGDIGAFLWGDGTYDNHESNLRVFDMSAGPFSYVDKIINADVTEWGKNAIDVVYDKDVSKFYVYLAMGRDGIRKYDVAAGAVMGSPDIYETYGPGPAFAGIGMDTFGDNGLANSLVVHGDYVYVAYGASGLCIFDKDNLEAGPVAQWNGIGSANYVAIDNTGTEDILWLGSGTGGMIMLKFVEHVGK